MGQDALRKALDEGSARALSEDRGGRRHLGASEIGARCARQAFYSFRWFYQVQHGGRILRLFDRGNQEEFRLVRWLRASGFEVRDYAERLVQNDITGDYETIPWDESIDESLPGLCFSDVSKSENHIKLALAQGVRLAQWGFADHDRHFAGSSDGKLRGPSSLVPDGWGGAEFKTHNDKSFADLVKKGVLSSKPVHWVQMQIYVHYLELPWCLYVAVNKNDDSIYTEIVHYKPEVAGPYVDRADSILKAKQPPSRLTEDPSWFECKFCDFREICHYSETPMKSCRTCGFSRPDEQGSWYCEKYHSLIPRDFERVGCDQWDPIS